MFGGNFLHGYDIRRQLRVYDIEQQTRVPNKFRFPMYEHLHWYAAAYYIKVRALCVRGCVAKLPARSRAGLVVAVPAPPEVSSRSPRRPEQGRLSRGVS